MKKRKGIVKQQSWHGYFAHMVALLLEPVALEVRTEAPIMSTSPVVDLLIMRPDSETWTPEQLKRLPDGIRQSKARSILIEFKYMESLSETSLNQIISYDALYKSKKGVKAQEVQSYIVFSQSPRDTTVTEMGFAPTDLEGVYASKLPVLRNITVISLNDLDDSSCNAAFKLFASKRKEMLEACDTLLTEASYSSNELMRLATFLYRMWIDKGGRNMASEFSREEIDGLTWRFSQQLIASMPVEERLKGLEPEARLAGLSPEEILAGLSPEEILSGLSPEEILSGLSPKQRDDFERALMRKRPTQRGHD